MLCSHADVCRAEGALLVLHVGERRASAAMISATTACTLMPVPTSFAKSPTMLSKWRRAGYGHGCLPPGRFALLAHPRANRESAEKKIPRRDSTCERARRIPETAPRLLQQM